MVNGATFLVVSKGLQKEADTIWGLLKRKPKPFSRCFRPAEAGIKGLRGDHGPGTNAELNEPQNVCVKGEPPIWIGLGGALAMGVETPHSSLPEFRVRLDRHFLDLDQ